VLEFGELGLHHLGQESDAGVCIVRGLGEVVDECVTGDYTRVEARPGSFPRILLLLT